MPVNENPAYTVVTLNCSPCGRRSATLYAAKHPPTPARCPSCGTPTLDYALEQAADAARLYALLEYLHAAQPPEIR